MKPIGLTSWRHLIVVAQAALMVSGCLERSRLNTSCEWVGDPSSTALDLSVTADRRHLTNDARTAGENATRYRDSVQKHFGFAAAGELDVECLNRLYATIGTRHSVRRIDLDAYAGKRDVVLDTALVYLPIGAAFLFVSRRMCRRRFHRMPPPGERWTVLVAVAWLGLGASAAATAVAYLHSWNVETARLRDFHISFRAAYLPIGRHPLLSFLMAVTVFAVIGLYEYRAARLRPAEQAGGSYPAGWPY